MVSPNRLIAKFGNTDKDPKKSPYSNRIQLLASLYFGKYTVILFEHIHGIPEADVLVLTQGDEIEY